MTLAWRYDSGLVAGSVPDYATALTLTPDQQAAIGLFCGGTTATLSAPITSCNSPSFGATRVVIPGTPANPAAEDDVANPPRIAPRHLFDVIGQSFAIAQDMMSSVWRSVADLVIEPDVAGFDYDDFKRAGELIRVGELAMRRVLPEVRKWLETPAEAPAPLKTPALVARPTPMPAD